MNEKNAADYSAMADIDGVLVGGASLNAKPFDEIIAAFAKGEQKPMKKVAIGSDHGGYQLKESIKKYLTELGIEYLRFWLSGE